MLEKQGKINRKKRIKKIIKKKIKTKLKDWEDNERGKAYLV